MKVWALVGVTVIGIVAQPVLIVVGGIPLLSRDALDQTFPIIPLAVLVGAVVGALIIDRQQLSSSRVPGGRIRRLYGSAGSMRAGTNNRAAALPMLSSSATATNGRRCRTSIASGAGGSTSTLPLRCDPSSMVAIIPGTAARW